uniref:hypothetical protein n=1 Tax=Chitinivorax sp. B TaxID=2502235 RepID=UPI0014853EE0
PPAPVDIPVMVGAALSQVPGGQYRAGGGVEAGQFVQFDPNQGLSGFDAPSGASLHRNTAVESSRGSLNLPNGAVAYWGRWDENPPSQTFILSRNGVVQPHSGPLHYLFSPMQTLPVNLTAANMGIAAARYVVAGGTLPTSENPGETGQLQDLQMTVNFANQRIDNYQVKVDFNGRTFSGVNTDFAPLQPHFRLNLAGTCIGCVTLEIPVMGEAQGALIGPQGEGAITSFGLNSLSTIHHALGNGVLQQIDRYGTPPAIGPIIGPEVMVGADIEQLATHYMPGNGIHMTQIKRDANGNVISFDDFTGLSFRANAAILQDAGNMTLPTGATNTQINWGRWESIPPTAEFQVTQNGFPKQDINSFYFIHADRLTPPTNMTPERLGITTAIYDKIAGPPATTAILGELGNIDKLTVQVNFATHQIERYDVGVQFANRRFDASQANTTMLAPTFSVGLTGQCTGCSAAAIPVNGNASGAFVGPQAEALITTFGLYMSTGNQAVIGGAVAKR